MKSSRCILFAVTALGFTVQAADVAKDLFRTIPAAKGDELTPANGWPTAESYRHWTRSLGGPTSNRFSALEQINKTNVATLELAWTYNSGDGSANVQCNPIVVDGVMFAPTAGKNIVALDAATGKERWRFAPEKQGNRQEDTPARRGLLHWPGDAEHPARLIFACGNWIYALNPKTGKPVEEFGKNGRMELTTGGTAAGAVFRHVLVVPGFLGDVFGYDVRSGQRLWTFHTRPTGEEYGADTWSMVAEGANCWGGMAMDESRGIAVIGLGSPKPNFFGMSHLGDNLYGNCVLALDALTGKRLWHFQEVRHDVWDWDIPAPPNLVTIERDGVRVDAVAQVTKLGNTLLLDRVSGKPIFPFRLRRAPELKLPGDKAAEYQPSPELPEPFARQHFTMKDLTNRTPEARAAVMPLVERANLGWFPPFEEAKPTVMFNIHGGAQWTGAAADPRGRLYVSSNEVPWAVTVFRDDDPAPAKPATVGETAYLLACAACHGPDRVGIGHAPPLRGVRHRMSETDLRALVKTGRNGMPPQPQLAEEQVKAIADFVLCRDRPITADTNTKPAWTFTGWNKLLDPQGYPACTPPWGTLNCIDLNTGRIAWKVPLGEYGELTKAGVPKTGTENFGGAMVTAGGLVFVSGTRDRKLRAFDADTGAELWSTTLPLHGTAPPAS
ncbi:MAG: PQQ-binding-like beta-propeller repeat protein, partial [Chthoniobacteraceae bacterium]